ncbi:MAG: DnaJ domain-containing protein, partial [Candidatus Gastranaerophilales bacterium]|nr:DnaJ domain-containing protein [Candidatus Gastranaerophilales bacterium]
MIDCAKNLYEILDVSPNSTTDEIKAAYKKLVRIYHPDLNKSKSAETAFKLLNNAYGILSNKEKRNKYNTLLETSKQEKITRNEDIIIKEVKITQDEATRGTTRTVNILNKQKCPKCTGRKFINGMICSFCLGEGEKNIYRKIDVQINKNTENGDLIFAAKVNQSALYDKKLYLKIKIERALEPVPTDFGMAVNVEIPLYDAILGKKSEINLKGVGFIDFVIPPLCAPNTKIALVGNYYALINVIFPKNIS